MMYSIDVGYRFLFQVIKHIHAPLCHANNGVHRTDFVVTTNVLIRLQVNTCTNAGTYFPAREPLFVHAVLLYHCLESYNSLCDVSVYTYHCYFFTITANSERWQDAEICNGFWIHLARVTSRLYTVKKKGPRGVRFEGCYSPGSVMATHKCVELTSWGVGRLR